MLVGEIIIIIITIETVVIIDLVLYTRSGSVEFVLHATLQM